MLIKKKYWPRTFKQRCVYYFCRISSPVVPAQSSTDPARALWAVAQGLVERARVSRRRAQRAGLAHGRRGWGHDPLQDHLRVHADQRLTCQQVPGALQQQGPRLTVTTSSLGMDFCDLSLSVFSLCLFLAHSFKCPSVNKLGWNTANRQEWFEDRQLLKRGSASLKSVTSRH